MCCSLYHATDDHPVHYNQPSTAMAGTLVSSLHRLKDTDNTGECIFPTKPRAPNFCRLTGTSFFFQTDGGFFVFGDLSIKVEGNYRLQFTLFEMQRYTKGLAILITTLVADRNLFRDNVVALKSILSDPFSGERLFTVCGYSSSLSNFIQVLLPKSFPGMHESTHLSRSFADQGVKLRIRKEARNVM